MQEWSAPRSAQRGELSDEICAFRPYKYGNHLTHGLTEAKSHAAFLTSVLAEGLRVRLRGIPALETL